MSKKLENIQEDLTLWDGFRGCQDMAWRLEGGVEEYAIMCSCGEWWGWHSNLRMMMGILDKMQEEGCALC